MFAPSVSLRVFHKGKEIVEELPMSHGRAARQAELVKALFECMPAFPLSHACIVTELTPIVTIDRRVGWTYPPALPKWEGGWSVDGYDDIHTKNALNH